MVAKRFFQKTLFWGAVAPMVLLCGSKATANTYERARCFHVAEDSYKPCTVSVENNSVSLSFTKEEFQSENKTVSGQSIVSIVSSYRRGAPKIDSPRQTYILQGKDSDLANFRVLIEDAPELQQTLTQISKKYISFDSEPPSSYSARCIYPGLEDFKSCVLTFEGSTLNVFFDKVDDGSQTTFSLPGKQIANVASGNYARQLITNSAGAAVGILLGPVVSVGKTVAGLAYDQEAQEYILKLVEDDGDHSAAVLRVSRAQAPQFQQQLVRASGKFIFFQEPNNNTVVNVGPDVKLPDVDVDL